MLYRCQICDEYKDDDEHPAEYFDDLAVCPSCLEDTPEDKLPGLLRRQTS